MKGKENIILEQETLKGITFKCKTGKFKLVMSLNTQQSQKLAMLDLFNVCSNHTKIKPQWRETKNKKQYTILTNLWPSNTVKVIKRLWIGRLAKFKNLEWTVSAKNPTLSFCKTRKHVNYLPCKHKVKNRGMVHLMYLTMLKKNSTRLDKNIFSSNCLTLLWPWNISPDVILCGWLGSKHHLTT